MWVGSLKVLAEKRQGLLHSDLQDTMRQAQQLAETLTSAQATRTQALSKHRTLRALSSQLSRPDTESSTELNAEKLRAAISGNFSTAIAAVSTKLDALTAR
ncbi:hypothetical protein B484DRAFT_390726 [Ochromonadaceae sp. CCMP2298]|nr:hypothetical protein B484DRAFT_390726 [Ochromonadaceae sp. CCMP2298]